MNYLSLIPLVSQKPREVPRTQWALSKDGLNEYVNEQIVPKASDL